MFCVFERLHVCVVICMFYVYARFIFMHAVYVCCVYVWVVFIFCLCCAYVYARVLCLCACYLSPFFCKFCVGVKSRVQYISYVSRC